MYLKDSANTVENCISSASKEMPEIEEYHTIQPTFQQGIKMSDKHFPRNMKNEELTGNLKAKFKNKLQRYAEYGGGD